MTLKSVKTSLTSFSLALLILLTFFGLYAPFFATSQPFAVRLEGQWFFPFFRTLLYKGFYTKPIDLFFNALMITTPLGLFLFWMRKKFSKIALTAAMIALSLLQLVLFVAANSYFIRDPALDMAKRREKEELVAQKKTTLSSLGFDFEKSFFSDYEKINQLVHYKLMAAQAQRLRTYAQRYEKQFGKEAPLQFFLQQNELKQTLSRLEKQRAISGSDRQQLDDEIKWLKDKQRWLQEQSATLMMVGPLWRPFHWEEDAGGSDLFNTIAPLDEVTRANRKDLMASLIFGIRISLVVGLMATLLSLAIGVPFGLISGYRGGKMDLILFRLLEIWESMPSFFMLLLIIAITHTKSIFLVILALSIFSWPQFARFIRAETLRERSKAYVMASKGMGFSSSKIMFSEILPNAIFPIFALLPFTMMGAISAEAGLSFLGLGEENSSSLGTLMSEARSFFPAESYLLWPPGCIISLLLIGFALLGDGLREKLDPRA